MVHPVALGPEAIRLTQGYGRPGFSGNRMARFINHLQRMAHPHLSIHIMVTTTDITTITIHITERLIQVLRIMAGSTGVDIIMGEGLIPVVTTAVDLMAAVGTIIEFYGCVRFQIVALIAQSYDLGTP